MAIGQNNLAKAKIAKNDEFYTDIHDIENEVNRYRAQLKGKIILMPCDDPQLIPGFVGTSEESSSKFWVFFHKNFNNLGLKKIIATHFAPPYPAYMIEYSGGNDQDVSAYTQIDLKENGDFRSEEVKKLFKISDIIITNPPFSLFREFVSQIVEMNKKFLIIGNKNAISYKETFKLFLENKIWLGYTNVKEFDKIDGTSQIFGNVGWFTNLQTSRRNEKLELYKSYTKKEYQNYDNYDAINVDKVTEIPKDYYGAIGVPITFLDKYNPEQFEILGSGASKELLVYNKRYTNPMKHMENKITSDPSLNCKLTIAIENPIKSTYYSDGKKYLIVPYARLIIKRRGK